MQAGSLKHTLVFQNPDYSRDNQGGFVPVQHNDSTTGNWTTLETVKASIEPLRGNQYYEARQVNSEVTHKIQCRWSKNLAENVRPAQTRIKFSDCATDVTRYFHIETAYTVHEKRRIFELLVKEVV